MFLGVLIGLGLLFIFWTYVHCFGSYRCCICRHDGGEGQWLIEEGTSFGDHYCNCYGCICLFYVRLTRNNAVYLKDSRNVNYQSLAPQVIRLSSIQLKFREISSCFILETDFRFEFLVQNMHVLRISSTYGKEKGHFD